MQKIVIQTHSAAETMQLAEQMGSLLQAGDCIAYFGGLGAGKTTFTRGLAKAWGCRMKSLPRRLRLSTSIMEQEHCPSIISICIGLSGQNRWKPQGSMIIRWRKMYLPLNGQKILQIVCRKIGLQ